MKAAVLYKEGEIPKYGELPDPKPKNDNEVVVNVKAASVKNLDKLKASGKHYTKHAEFPASVGFDGAGTLEDGTRVFAYGLTGMIAEKALVEKNKYVKLPDNVSFEIAAALPNALMGSDMALVYRADIQEGDIVLVNGATGVTGKIAVQMAKFRGAYKVFVTGRNDEALEELLKLGADEAISLKYDDDAVIRSITRIQNENPIDFVLDYIWGHPIELVLAGLKNSASNRTRIISIGDLAGQTITLPSSYMRGTQIKILGSGIGSIKPEQMDDYTQNILPEVLSLAAQGKLKIDIKTVPLKDVEAAWTMKPENGARIVIEM